MLEEPLVIRRDVEQASSGASEDQTTDRLLNQQGEYPKNDAAIIERIKKGVDNEDDVKNYILHVSHRLKYVACCWEYCCGCCYCHNTFTFTVLAQLHGLAFKERFSLVMGFWFLIISLLILLLGGSDQFIPILMVSTIISVVLRCKLDDCMEKTSEFNNSILQFLIGICKFVEQITYIIILVVTLPFSCLEACFLQSRWYGGDPPILQERETVTSVTLDQLIDDINMSSSDSYCFLRVLEKADRALFLSRVLETDYVDIFQRKAIKLSIWLNIMGSVRLSANYVIYRRAYWGENRGKRDISDRLTDYLVPLWHFDRYEVKSKKSLVEELIRMFQNFNVRDPVIRILLRDNHMESFEFSSKYRLCSWENTDYVFPNERYGRSDSKFVVTNGDENGVKQK